MGFEIRRYGPKPKTKMEKFKAGLRRMRKRYEGYKEQQRQQELKRAQVEIAEGEILLKRDKIRTARAQAKQRMVKAGGGSFKERLQYSQGDPFSSITGFGGTPDRRPRKSRPKKKKTRSQRDPFDRLMWG